MKQITPYLFFDGNCRDVMQFYGEVFELNPSIMMFDESPEAEKMPQNKGRVMHAAIMKGDSVMFMASDTMMPGQTAEMGEGNYSTIICDSKEEIDTLFQKLSEGGKVNMPLEEAFFGWFGSLTDKFGVKWMLEFDNPKE